jgi:single-strand selective monofunctional uracil DNA glycosylase
MGRHRQAGDRHAAEELIRASRELSREVERLRFALPVAYVYNPLRYARAAYEQYVERYARAHPRVVLVGMNPGPWGMAQTGVPFGDVATVKEWLRIDAPIGSPRTQHPARSVRGLLCPRVEVSGRRLWGLARERFGEPDSFFREHFVENYCPLLFLEASGRNRTPDAIAPPDREPLYAACDRHLLAMARALSPAWLVGVGTFAASRIRHLLARSDLPGVRAGSLPHPSPASPRANAGWTELAVRTLEEQGIWPAADASRGT